MVKLDPDLSISLIQQSEMLYNLFFLYVQVEVYKIILNISCWPLALTLHEVFLKNKKRSGTSLPTSFSTWFLKNNISRLLIVLIDQISSFDCLYLLRYWAILNCNYPFALCDVIKPFSYMTKKSGQKFKYLMTKKSF